MQVVARRAELAPEIPGFRAVEVSDRLAIAGGQTPQPAGDPSARQAGVRRLRRVACRAALGLLVLEQDEEALLAPARQPDRQHAQIDLAKLGLAMDAYALPPHLNLARTRLGQRAA